jgi:hypothetical protein
MPFVTAACAALIAGEPDGKALTHVSKATQKCRTHTESGYRVDDAVEIGSVV